MKSPRFQHTSYPFIAMISSEVRMRRTIRSLHFSLISKDFHCKTYNMKNSSYVFEPYKLYLLFHKQRYRKKVFLGQFYAYKLVMQTVHMK